MLLKQLFILLSNKLKSVGIETYNLDARIIIQFVLNLDHNNFYDNYDTELSSKDIAIIKKYIDRRCNYEPIAYITGNREFYDIDFIVDNTVLIPRSDSETLISAILNNDLDQNVNILDLGTGSGVLLLTLLKNIPHSRGVGIDIASLDIANMNAKKLNLKHQVIFQQCSWNNYIDYNQHNIIIANPPYINKQDLELISKETIQYEPHLALFTQKDNSYLEIYNNIVNKFYGSIYLETSYNNHMNIINIFEKDDKFYLKSQYKDINGYVRCLHFISK